MIKNKRARRTAKTLRQIKLRWLRQLQLGCMTPTQSLLSNKHYIGYDKEQAKLDAIDYMCKVSNARIKQVNTLTKQIKKYKLK